MPNLAPIALFAYARPDHLRQTLEALSRNRMADQSELHIYSDGPKPDASAETQQRIHEVRTLIREQDWCGTVVIHESAENRGLAASIRGGASELLESHGRVIVVEDDLVTSPGFLEYMNSALETYQDVKTVWHISGFFNQSPYASLLPETFFLRHMSCWGWATWKDRWKHAEWDVKKLLEEVNATPETHTEFNLGGCNGYSDQLERNQRGEIKTWAIFWATSIFLGGGLCLTPSQSLVRNIGVDGSGENFVHNEEKRYRVELADQVSVNKQNAKVSSLGRFALQAFLRWGPEATPINHLKGELGRLKHRLSKRFA
ncbi:MAG: hypothetical protein AAFX93_05375 [Verrucomicrobiota bacterium]